MNLKLKKLFLIGVSLKLVSMKYIIIGYSISQRQFTAQHWLRQCSPAQKATVHENKAASALVENEQLEQCFDSAISTCLSVWRSSAHYCCFDRKQVITQFAGH